MRTALWAGLILVAGGAAAGATDVARDTLDRPIEPHERARTWRTVVIPAGPAVSAGTVLPAWGVAVVTAARPPLSAPRTGITTAALPPRSEAVETAAKPLVGAAHQLSGIASYYWQDQMTSSGERFDKRAMTAAHKTLPLGTRVRVTHVASGRTVVVRINDRGPFKPGRVIDLSEAAAEQLQMTGAGLAAVTVEVVR